LQSPTGNVPCSASCSNASISCVWNATPSAVLALRQPSRTGHHHIHVNAAGILGVLQVQQRVPHDADLQMEMAPRDPGSASAVCRWPVRWVLTASCAATNAPDGGGAGTTIGLQQHVAVDVNRAFTELFRSNTTEGAADQRWISRGRFCLLGGRLRPECGLRPHAVPAVTQPSRCPFVAGHLFNRMRQSTCPTKLDQHRAFSVDCGCG
jgi:hypothetical protein